MPTPPKRTNNFPPNVPHRYPDLVQLRSTLMPTMGVKRYRDIPEAAIRLRQFWQARVHGLREAKWHRVVDPVASRNKYAAMVNCRHSCSATTTPSECAGS